MQGVRNWNLLRRICQRLQCLSARKLRHHWTVFLPRLRGRQLLLDGRISVSAVPARGLLARRGRELQRVCCRHILAAGEQHVQQVYSRMVLCLSSVSVRGMCSGHIYVHGWGHQLQHVSSRELLAGGAVPVHNLPGGYVQRGSRGLRVQVMRTRGELAYRGVSLQRVSARELLTGK